MVLAIEAKDIYYPYMLLGLGIRIVTGISLVTTS
jgi:hypothetical protein